MKKSVFFILMVFICSISKAQITISEDIPKHFAAGMVIGGIGGYAANKMFKGDRYWTWAGAVGSSLAAGLTKEAIDKANYGVWDNNDVLYTALGGVVSGLALELLIKKKVRGRIKVTCNCNAIDTHRLKKGNMMVINSTASNSRDIMANLQAQRILEMP